MRASHRSRGDQQLYDPTVRISLGEVWQNCFYCARKFCIPKQIMLVVLVTCNDRYLFAFAVGVAYVRIDLNR